MKSNEIIRKIANLLFPSRTFYLAIRKHRKKSVNVKSGYKSFKWIEAVSEKQAHYRKILFELTISNDIQKGDKLGASLHIE